MPTRWVHFRIPEDVHDRIKAVAAADRRSLSAWVTVACEKALESAEAERAAVDSAEVAQ
jgi:predicted HicB family RNase H-like nuclease